MLDSLSLAIRNEYILDSGPFYHEFQVDGLIKEPWNTYSSLLFFIPIIFWLFKLKGEYSKFKILVVLMPLLFLNGLGSTLYHAFRSNSFYLYLDSIPAALMSFTLASYFWTTVLNNALKGVGMVLAIFSLGFLSVKLLVLVPELEEMGPNFAYFIVGLTFFIPILIILIRTNLKRAYLILLTLIFLSLALLCRIIDHPSDLFSELMPQGTHFLWHAFSVLAVFTLGYYVYYLESEKPTKPTKMK